MAGNALDRLIGYVAPATAIRRIMARERLRAFEAASPRDPWKPRRSGASANADHQLDATKLRAKSRTLVQNVPYIAAGIRSRRAALIGTGIVAKFTGPDGARLTELYREWLSQCDADGLRDLYGLQADAAQAMDVDGEVLIRLRRRRPSDGLRVPLQLQLLEVDWIDTQRARGAGGNVVVNGIEYDALGRVVAYYLWDQHPGDLTLRRGTRTESRRVPASEIIHLYQPDRPGAGRGFPRLAPVIARVRDLQTYEDAELARKNLETRLAVLAAGDPTLLANDTGSGPAPGDASASLGTLESGSIIRIPDGLNLTVVEPKAAPGYVDYVKHQLHIICAGGGFTYEAATGDMREVNYSSARVRQLDFRREIEQMQWSVLIPQLCRRIVQEFAATAALAGLLRSEAPRFGVEFSTPKWDYVNPQQEIEADLREVAAGMSSISEKLRRRGYDPEQVFDELAADINALRSRGILDTLLAMQKARAETPAGDAAAAATNG